MNKFIYMCLVLPALTIKANVRQTIVGETIDLKKSTILLEENNHSDSKRHEGEMYLLDETGVLFALPNLFYFVESGGQLVVDLHINSEEQDKLKELLNASPKKRLVTMINEYAVGDVNIKDRLIENQTDLA